MSSEFSTHSNLKKKSVWSVFSFRTERIYFYTQHHIYTTREKIRISLIGEERMEKISVTSFSKKGNEL